MSSVSEVLRPFFIFEFDVLHSLVDPTWLLATHQCVVEDLSLLITYHCPCSTKKIFIQTFLVNLKRAIQIYRKILRNVLSLLISVSIDCGKITHRKFNVIKITYQHGTHINMEQYNNIWLFLYHGKSWQTGFFKKILSY